MNCGRSKERKGERQELGNGRNHSRYRENRLQRNASKDNTRLRLTELRAGARAECTS